MGEIPDFLTIEEASRVLRIGRTKAYAMGQEWRVTDGESGIKVCELGGQLRVPKAWLEEQLDAPVLCIPPAPETAKRNGDAPNPAPAPAAPEPPTAPAPPAAQPSASTRKPRRRKRAAANSNQLTLSFS